MKSIQYIENFRLTDGGMALINKLGRMYSFTRTYNSFDLAPDMVNGLNKQAAYKLLSDTLRNDVLDIDS